MFLIGTALLMFAMGLYTMFYGSNSIQKLEQHINSSHSGTFNLKGSKPCQYVYNTQLECPWISANKKQQIHTRS
jgi:hypothetical protein